MPEKEVQGGPTRQTSAAPAKGGVIDKTDSESSGQAQHDETIEFVDAVIVADLAVDDEGWANVSPQFDTAFSEPDASVPADIGPPVELADDAPTQRAQETETVDPAKDRQAPRSQSTVVRAFASGSDAVDFDTISPNQSDVESGNEPGIAVAMDVKEFAPPPTGHAAASTPMARAPRTRKPEPDVVSKPDLGPQPADAAEASDRQSRSRDTDRLVPGSARLGTSPTSAAIRMERTQAANDRTEAEEPAPPIEDKDEPATVHRLDADRPAAKSPFGSLDDIILNRRSLRDKAADASDGSEDEIDEKPVAPTLLRPPVSGPEVTKAEATKSEIVVLDPAPPPSREHPFASVREAVPETPSNVEDVADAQARAPVDTDSPVDDEPNELVLGEADAVVDAQPDHASQLRAMASEDRISGEAEEPARVGPIINYGDDEVTIRDRLRNLYPERQIFYRANGQVKFITFPTSLQVGVTAASLLLFGWIGFVTVYYFAFEWMMETKGRQAMEAQQAYQSLVQEVDRYNEQFSTAAQKMEGSRQTLAKLVHRLDKAGSRPELELPAPLDADHIVTTSLPPLPGDSIEVVKGRWHALADRSEEIESGWTTLENKVEGIISANEVVTSERDDLSEQVNELSSERSELHQQVRRLEQTLVALRSSQSEIIRRVTRNTRDQVIEVEKLITMTGLDLDGLLEKQRRTDNEFADVLPEAQGGPFVELASLNLPPNDPLEPKVVALDTQMARQHDLQRLVRLLPLASPVDHYRLTSGFGRRRDPIRKRWSQHQGLDLANLTGTPILTPAPGRVVFAGWRGNFGRLVEIDHGLGIRTRYGHLKKLFVKTGQQVGFRHKIAAMGNSGRSTGSHLHYEIRVDGVPMNPVNFLRAGKYVFK